MPRFRKSSGALLSIFALMALAVSARSADGPREAKPDDSEKARVERGFRNLTSRPYGPSFFNEQLIGQLWTVWDDEWKKKVDPKDPAQIRRLIYERYGFSEAPYENNGLPMQFVSNGRGGWVTTCMSCHGGRVPGTGKSMIGMPNTELDLGTLLEDVAKMFGGKANGDHQSVSRGRTNAFIFSLELLRVRKPDLSSGSSVEMGDFHDHDLDAPPWWHLKKKKTLYADGFVGGDFRRAIMQFTMPEPSGEKIRSWEHDFGDIYAYLKTIEPPKYPWPIDRRLADAGKKVFERTCSECHGTYGPTGRYPNRVVPIERVGTDSLRLTGLTREFRAYYGKSWFAQDGATVVAEPVGYVAPPLDGIWASAPYFHNGSAPTVYGVLTAEARPKFFRRAGTIQDYDPVNLGLKFETLDGPAPPGAPNEARRRVVNTTLPGLGNQGHPFGFVLTEKQKRQVIEYLKTL